MFFFSRTCILGWTSEFSNTWGNIKDSLPLRGHKMKTCTKLQRRTLSLYFSSKHCCAFCLITQSIWIKDIFSLAQSLSLSLTLSNKHTEFLKKFLNFLITASFFMFPNFKLKRLPMLGIVLWCWFMKLMQKRTVLPMHISIWQGSSDL